MADEDRALTEDEKKARKKADRERKRQEARDAAEKKKRFGLTPEKKTKTSSFNYENGNRKS